MITGRVELANPCHGADDGKFCETPGPGASGGDWPDQRGREVKVVVESKKGLLGPKIQIVDDVPSRKVYEVEASDGTKLRAYIVDGRDDPAAISQTLNSMAAQHEMYPSKPPRKAILINDATSVSFHGSDGPQVGAWVYPTEGYRQNIFINSDNLYGGRAEKALAQKGNENWMMPKARDGNINHYLVTHESGHQYDFMGSRNSAKPLFENPAIKKHLSEYGRTIKEEGYAEAFAEWHTSRGKTPNPAARAYAKHEGWYGTDGYKKPSLRGSGTMEEFQMGEAPDIKELAPKDGAMIADTFNADKGPIVKGDLPDEPVSEKEKADADKLVEEVFRAMGYDAEGNELKFTSTGHIELHLIGQHDQGAHGAGGGGGRGGGGSSVVEKKYSEVTGKNSQGKTFTKYKQLKKADLTKFSDNQLKTLHKQSDLDQSAAKGLKDIGLATVAIGAGLSGVAARSKNPDADPGAGIVVAGTGALMAGLGAVRERQVSKQKTRIEKELKNRNLSTDLSLHYGRIELQEKSLDELIKSFEKTTKKGPIKNITVEDISTAKDFLLAIKDDTDEEISKSEIDKALEGLKTVESLLPLRASAEPISLKQKAIDMGIIREQS